MLHFSMLKEYDIAVLFWSLCAMLLLSGPCFAQNSDIRTKHLKGEWYTSNDDSLFFKSDTLVLLKRSDNNLVLDKMCVSPDMAREKGLLNCEDFVNLRLRTRGRFEMWLYEGYTSEVWLKPMKWHLNDDILSIESENLIWNYMIIQMDTVNFSEKQYSFSNRYANLRLKMHRVWPDPVPKSDTLQLPTQTLIDSFQDIKRKNTLRNLDSKD